MKSTGVALAAGTVLALLAPLGTHNFSPVLRFTFWIGLCLAGGAGASAILFLVERYGKAIPLWLSTLLQAIGATIFVAIFMFSFFPIANGNPLISTAYIFLISIVICTIGSLARKASETPTTPADTAPQRAAIYDRLPPRLREADIYAIASEDHYVRIYTAKGEEMTLMRLADAIKETQPLRGLSPHRSWWVAEKGVDAVKRQDGKVIITLLSGQAVPVSRSKVKDVKDQGWIS